VDRFDEVAEDTKSQLLASILDHLGELLLLYHALHKSQERIPTTRQYNKERSTREKRRESSS